MAIKCDDIFLDGGLDAVATCTRISVTSAEPANVGAVPGITLATTTLSAPDFTKADGDVSGRKVTIAEKADVSITASGTANHVVIDDATNIYVTTCGSQELSSGGTVTIPAWKVEIADPVAA